MGKSETLVALGMSIAILGTMTCIVVGATLWEVSPTLSKMVGLYGSIGVIVGGGLIFGWGLWEGH